MARIPRRRRVLREPDGTYKAPNAIAGRPIRASASRIPLEDRKQAARLTSKRQEWQDESWEYFDEVPEIKYSTWFLGNAMGKLRLFAAVVPADDPDAKPIPVTDPNSGIPPEVANRAVLELDRIRSPLGGQGEVCRELNMNLEIAAEAYLVGIGPRVKTVHDEVTDTDIQVITPETFSIRSVSEVDVDTSTKKPVYKISDRPDDPDPVKLDPLTDVIIRIWQRHPRYSFLPDNNMRGVLEECARLVQLGNQISAESKSHMSAGILTIPNELSFGPLITTEGENSEDDEKDQLDEELERVTTEPVQDPESMNVVNPMALRGPAEYLKPEYVRHIKFGREMTSVLEDRIQKRVERIARGMNLPVEVVLGHQQTTFSNASQVDEDTFDDHLQPRCELICDALTVGFLRPNLFMAGYDEAIIDRIIVWYDPSRLIKGVDPKEHVEAAHTNGTISDEAYRRYLGFDEDDAPTAEERLIRAVMHLRSFDPGVSTAILDLLGVKLDIPTELPGSASSGASTDGNPNARVTLEDLIVEVVRAKHAVEHEKITASRSPKALRQARARSNVGRKLMDIDRDLRTRLLVASSRALLRALEKAGNRLKAKTNRGKTDIRAVVKGVHARYACAQVGPKLVAAAGFTEDELIGEDAWDEVETQFMAWGANAQRAALDAVHDVVGLTTAARDNLEARQITDLKEAWSWMKDSLHDLAVAKLYGPDVHEPDVGEFDPMMHVPTGLVRQALARAGGANGIVTVQGGNPYVVLNNDKPPGGIATGQLVMDELKDGGADTEGYEWVYGPAARVHPFEDHEMLDGYLFTSFEDDELASDGSFPETDFMYPGDHDGCACDVSPVILAPDEVVIDSASGDAHFADQQPEDGG